MDKISLARLIREARGLVARKKVKFKGTGRSIDFYEVAGNSVEVFRDKNSTKMKCTCKHHSIMDDDSMCCTKLAVIFYVSEMIEKYDKS